MSLKPILSRIRINHNCLTLAVAVLASIALSSSAFAISSEEILDRVKQAENGIHGFSAGLVVSDLNSKGISNMGSGYAEIMKLNKATVVYTLPDIIHVDGVAHGIKASYDQDGYMRYIKLGLIKLKQNMKDSPSKLQSSLDLGFLSSKLWQDNNISVIGSTDDCEILKLKPKFGINEQRHVLVWVDREMLRVLKIERYRSSGDLRARVVNQSFACLEDKFPIATVSVIYDPQGTKLGTVSYKDLKAIVKG